jgi:hypothetical protein
MGQSVAHPTAEGAAVPTQSILTRVLTTTRLLSAPYKTLAILVAAAIRREGPNLDHIGPKMAGTITTRAYGMVR